MRCLMPGARLNLRPLSAASSSSPSAADEVSQLEQNLQRQLEEDIARIFDESIYSDLEVVCGKLKIQTHSCILKARTRKFYNNLEAILHLNIGRNTFDEIYSFISDAYTECNIQHQEKEIIQYLREHFNLGKTVKNSCISKPEEKEETEVYSTPDCVSPEENSFQKALSASPSTEINKAYYALVPIESNVIDRELIEQDALSDAFQSINKSKYEEINKSSNHHNKPTSLCLNSSHICKINKHSSNNCDIIEITKTTDLAQTKITKYSSELEQNLWKFEAEKSSTSFTKESEDSSTDKTLAYTPDSLYTDDPSSSSDYISAAYAVSPETVCSNGDFQSITTDNVRKMDNINTTSDSGLETAGIDVTLSLSENTVYDDDTYKDMSSNVDQIHAQIIKRSASLHSSACASTDKQFPNKISNKSLTDMRSKEEKQRHNEEIVILESSSISSETGSWESVFPPKLQDKDICERFINSERSNALGNENAKDSQSLTEIQNLTHDNSLCQNLLDNFDMSVCFVPNSPIRIINIDSDSSLDTTNKFDLNEPAPSTANRDQSPIDLSIENEDSLEHRDGNLPEETSPLTMPTAKENVISISSTPNNSIIYISCEDSPLPSSSAQIRVDEGMAEIDRYLLTPSPPRTPKSVLHSAASSLACTPHNDSNACREISKITWTPISPLSPKSVLCSVNSSIVCTPHDNDSNNGRIQTNEFASHRKRYFDVKEKHKQCVEHEAVNTCCVVNVQDNYEESSSSGKMPCNWDSHNNSPYTKKRLENIRNDSTADITQPETALDKPKAPSNSSFWVVDMSNNTKSDKNAILVDKTGDLEPIRHPSTTESYKSRSSVDSDSSEKSTHNFFIDLSTLPDALPSENEQEHRKDSNKLFSMFIDLDDKVTAPKEMPARFSSSTNMKKSKLDNTNSSKSPKTPKGSCSNSNSTQPTPRPTVHHRASSILFAKLESLCENTTLSVSEILNNALAAKNDSENTIESSITKDNPKYPDVLKNNDFPRDKNVSKNKNIPKEKDILKDTDVPKDIVVQEPAAGEFVKLSDLDNPAPQVYPTPVKKDSYSLMTSSIPYIDFKKSRSLHHLKSAEIISSFHSENATSLNRIFPDLQKDFSSMPCSLSKSPDGTPERLDISSVQSSYCRYIIDKSSEEMDPTSSLMENCQSRLGQDLLRMFLEEIAPDVLVEVSGRRIKAHKCILSSRCQYFAGILSGNRVENAGNIIVLPPFSFSTVHFALCHIYSGVATIPESISIVEMATLADMLCLDGLKEGIMCMLKNKYCHHFHKPCPICTAGVLECFPLASVYALDDLFRKCLRWITKFFPKIWPTKAFATLPLDLIDRCCMELIVNLSVDNFSEVVCGCGITSKAASLHTGRWVAVVERQCCKLLDAAKNFAASQLCEVLRAMRTVPLHTAPASSDEAVHALRNCVLSAIQSAPLDELCRAYSLLTHYVEQKRQPAESAEDESVLDAHAGSWWLRCDVIIIRNGPRVLMTPAFDDLPLDMRGRLHELSSVPPFKALAPRQHDTTARGARAARALPRASPHSPAASRRARDLDQVRACFVPYAKNPPHALAAAPRETCAPKLVSGMSVRGHPHNKAPPVRTTKAHEKRAKHNLNKVNPTEPVRKVAKLPRKANENTKSRYMEPRNGGPSVRKPAPRLVSSSESSRNSSPVAGRRLAARVHTADPSTDSLSELCADKYATYTRPKHANKGSVESVATAQSQPSTSYAAVKNTANTKIPVYHNKTPKASSAASVSREPKRLLSDNSQNNDRPTLMCATKSSQAKMVTKKKTKDTKTTAARERAAPPDAEIPVMERSGTFLKDQPTFGDKTSNNDIDKDKKKK